MNAANSSIVAYGQLEDVAAALSGLTYAGQTSEFSGTDTITLEVVDAGGMVASRVIKVDIEADSPPKITRVGRLASSPRNLLMDEDGELLLDSLHVSTSNTAAESTVQVEIFCTNGIVSLPKSKQGADIVISMNMSAGVIIAGNTNRVNDALRSLVYRPDADVWGSDEISIIAREGMSGIVRGWSTIAGSESIIVLIEPVNDAPTIDISDALTRTVAPVALAGEFLPLEEIVVHDVDAGEEAGSQLVLVNVSTGLEGNMVSLATGKPTVHGRIPGVLFFEGSAEGAYPAFSFRGPINLVNAALSRLQFWAPFGHPNGLENVTIVVADYGNWGKGVEEVATASLAIDVRYREDPLAVDHGFIQWKTPPGALSVREDGQLDVLGIALITDDSKYPANSTWVDVTVAADHGLVQVVDARAETDRKPAVEIVRHGLGSLTISGAVEEVSAALAGCTYIPDPNYHGLETLGLSAQGRSEEWATNTSAQIVVLPEPDVPTITVGNTPTANSSMARTVDVGSRLPLHGVNVQHADALHSSTSDMITLRVYSAAGSGTAWMNDSIPGLWVYAEEAGSVLVARGSVDTLQQALDAGGLEYVPAGEHSGTDILVLTVSASFPYSALGNETSDVFDDLGEVEHATAELEVTVVPAFVPAAVALEDGALFSTTEGVGVLITGVRINAPGRRNTSEVVVSVSFGVDRGGIRLPRAAGRQVIAKGQGESTMLLTGAEFEVNIAMLGAVFHPAPFFNGVADVKVNLVTIPLSIVI